jgi:hypothetical protein
MEQSSELELHLRVRITRLNDSAISARLVDGGESDRGHLASSVLIQVAEKNEYSRDVKFESLRPRCYGDQYNT